MNSSAGAERVVRLAVVIGVDKLAEPLEKVEIVHEFAFDQAVDRHHFIHLNESKRVLQISEILSIFHFHRRVEDDLGARTTTRKQHLHELTIHFARGKLLDFRQSHLEHVVDPLEVVVATVVVDRHRRDVHIDRVAALRRRHRVVTEKKRETEIVDGVLVSPSCVDQTESPRICIFFM